VTVLIPPPDQEDVIFIKDLSLSCIIGVNSFEKIEKQRIIINISLLFKPELIDSKVAIPVKNNYRTVASRVSLFIENSRYQTLEMMAHDLCQLILLQCKVQKVTVRLEKPSAVMFAKTAGVEITRQLEESSLVAESSSSKAVHVFVAFGSNLGNRVANIEQALQILQENNISIIDSSFLYESAPMYVTDQPRFINGVVKVLNF
jgi:dihydroneopterin aldolase/2-amino-4-hydroxy-6-hydroxymethyldihydropteridine diphosphokinase/dihydropteroate synthase